MAAAWYRLGTSLLSQGREAEAKLAFEQGLRLKPGNAQLRQQLDKLRSARSGGKENEQTAAAGTAGAAEASQPAKAASAAAPSTSGSPPQAPAPAPLAESDSEVLAEAQKALGNEAYKAGRYEEAVRCYSAALELAPGVAVYYSNRSAAALMARDYKLAAADGLRAAELDPALARGFSRAAKAFMVLGQFEEAEGVLRRGLGVHPSLQQELVGVQILARKVAAGREALAGGEGARALVLAEAACDASIPRCEAAVRLRVEALLAEGRWVGWLGGVAGWDEQQGG